MDYLWRLLIIEVIIVNLNVTKTSQKNDQNLTKKIIKKMTKI